MTRSEALDIVIRIAARWGENAEERLPRRVRPTDTDEELAEMTNVGTEPDDYSFDIAKDCRDLWKAIEVLNSKTKQ
jgi:hypothetical protein